MQGNSVCGLIARHSEGGARRECQCFSGTDRLCTQCCNKPPLWTDLLLPQTWCSACLCRSSSIDQHALPHRVAFELPTHPIHDRCMYDVVLTGSAFDPSFLGRWCSASRIWDLH